MRGVLRKSHMTLIGINTCTCSSLRSCTCNDMRNTFYMYMYMYMQLYVANSVIILILCCYQGVRTPRYWTSI